MSYDLTIRADRDYSQFVAFKPLAEFISKLPHVRANGSSGFILDDSRRWMNIDLEVANEEGDSVEAEEEELWRVNCIRLHIPYDYLGDAPEQDYFPVAQEIAGLLGWRLYDAQTGEDVPRSPRPDASRGAFYREVRRALGLEEEGTASSRPRKPAKGKKKPSR
jgi:hypothetical protein